MRVSGPVSLWGGWSLILPSPCLVERGTDGSWSAWDAARTIDVQIIEVGGTAARSPVGRIDGRRDRAKALSGSGLEVITGSMRGQRVSGDHNRNQERAYHVFSLGSGITTGNKATEMWRSGSLFEVIK